MWWIGLNNNVSGVYWLSRSASSTDTDCFFNPELPKKLPDRPSIEQNKSVAMGISGFDNRGVSKWETIRQSRTIKIRTQKTNLTIKILISPQKEKVSVWELEALKIVVAESLKLKNRDVTKKKSCSSDETKVSEPLKFLDYQQSSKNKLNNLLR